MRLLSVLVGLLLSLLAMEARAHTHRSVLFLGNSYTGVNNLPQMVQDIAQAAGDTLVADNYAPGGYTFARHCTDITTQERIFSQQWDCVVMQGQSQEPSFPPEQVATQTLPYVVRLDSMVRANDSCTITVMYETWGRKNGDQQNCAFYPPLCTYTGMQERLRESYKLFADTCKTIMAPVGEAWRAVVENEPSIELYQADESHPTIAGTYLAACVLYEVLFEKSVVGNTFIADIEQNTANILQSIAHRIVRDSAQTWNIGRYERCVSITTVKENDGSTNADQSVNRTNCYHNPASTVVLVSFNGLPLSSPMDFVITDAVGSIVSSGVTTNVINVSALSAGMYYLVVGNEYHKLVVSR